MKINAITYYLKSLSLLLFGLITLAGCKKYLSDADYLISDINIIDVKTGEVMPGQYVAISGDSISAIYDRPVRTDDSVIVIEGTGKYLIPGLWDMHAHYNGNYEYSNPLLIANGITGVREMWGDMDTIKDLRKRSREGSIDAPDIYTAGTIIDGVPSTMRAAAGVSNKEEAVAEVNRQVKEGVDFIKVYSSLSLEAFHAIAERCNELEIPFAGHVPFSVTFWDAVRSNIRCVEHQTGFIEACIEHPLEPDKSISRMEFRIKNAEYMVNNFSRELFDSLASLIVESNTWLCPTFTVNHSMANLDDPSLTKDKRLEYMPPRSKRSWGQMSDTLYKRRNKDYYDAQRKIFNLNLSLIGDLEKAGVKIIAGTDFPNPFCYPGFSLHDELGWLVNGGMANLDALQAATINAAVFMEKEGEFGEVVKGQLASLVILNENPLIDINNARDILAVFLRGKYFDRSDLDSLLVNARELAATQEFDHKSMNPLGIQPRI
jgi:cytosine/adenosine deaminase-related metal-dependent hydrolase